METPSTYKGQLLPRNYSIGIVVSEFNLPITTKLLEGALQFFQEVDLSPSLLEIFYVPGAFEIPFLCDRILEKKPIHGILALGCVIKGETSHHEYVAHSAISPLQEIMLKHKKPISLGILTLESIDQGLERIGIKHENKGYEAAKSLWKLLCMLEKASLL